MEHPASQREDNWMFLWAAPAPARPRDALSPQVSVGSVSRIAPQFAFLTQIFRATVQPRETNGRITAVLHATSFPKKYARKPLGILKNVAESCRRGKLNTFFLITFCCASTETRAFEVNIKGSLDRVSTRALDVKTSICLCKPW